MNHAALLLACGASMVAALGASAGTPHDANVAPDAYRRLLARHVVMRPLAGGGFETRFDYAGLRAEAGQAEARRSLRERFLSVDPEALGDGARSAWAANAYNFFVIDVVTENLVGPGGDTLRSIADIGAGDFAVFDEERIGIGGERLSLNAFERRFLFGGAVREAGIAPRDLDPRLHFAIVCAAKGCPPLWPRPFEAARMDAQLDSVTANALLSPRHLVVDGGAVRVSKLFEWYAADFSGGVGIAAFLRRHAPGRMEAAAEPAPEPRPDIEWDWSLNRP